MNNIPYTLLTNKDLLPKIDKDAPLFCDIETHGLYLEVCLFQMYQDHWKQPVIIVYPIESVLKKIIEDNYTVWYNASYDLGTLGISPDEYEDLYYAAKTAYPLLESHALDSIEEHLGITCHDWVKNIKDHLGVTYPNKKNPKGFTKSEMQKSFASAKCKKSRTFTQEQLDYAAADTIGLCEMWYDDVLYDVIDSNKAYKADIQAQKDALIYQYNGMPVVEARRVRASNKAVRNLNINQRKLPKGLNVKSSIQVKDLFAELGVELQVDRKTGKLSTGEESLKIAMLNQNSKEAEYILNARKYRTRLQDLEGKYGGFDKIQTFFNAAGTITGRFSSLGGDRPGFNNIQNINRDLKSIFGYTEEDNRVMVNADYGTAELIAGCTIFKVPTMRETILNGIDLHKDTATWLADTTYDKVTKQERQSAKAVNFGLLFGMGIELFMSYAYTTYGVKFTREEAERAKALYYEKHPGIKAYHQYIGKSSKRNTFTVETALGRVAGNKRYTEYLNISVQGSIAESTKLSISHFIQNNELLLKENKIVNMVHDSIVGDVHKRHIEDWGDAVKKSMLYGWREVSKSDLFHYHDLPMGVDIEVSHEYGGEYSPEKVQEIIKAYR